MRFEVLGPIRVSHGEEMLAVAGRLRRNLLAMLLARANEPVRAETIADALWGERASNAGGSRLQVLVHRLRGVLDDPERLSFGPDGYCLRVGSGELDAERFGVLLDEADSAALRDPRRCAELIREAMRLWRGRPYEGVDVPDLMGDIQRLSERRLVALELLHTAELRCGRQAAIIGELSDLVRLHPMRERLHGLLMTALYRAGQQADALAAYRTARNVLVAELGLEPGPELRALEATILAGEPVPLGEPPPQRARPAQLPHNVSGFVGRDDELSQLDRLLAAGDESVLISAVAGTAGVGKTALAVRWAHRVKERFPDGQLYVDLRGYGPDQPASPEHTLAAFLRALGVDGTAIPPEPTERAALFRTLVDQKRLLVVLDNAHSADQVRPLLPGTATCFVVVTSRDALPGLSARDGAHRITLDRLTTDDAHHLLHELLGEEGDQGDVVATAQLIERCANLPLALRIAAERIREHPHRTIAELVSELADEQARLDLLDTGDDPHASVRAVFAASYRHLRPDTARLFRLLGVHPGHEFDTYAAAALLGVDLRETRRWLEALVRANLVEETTGHRYRLHDLLRSYAAELAETIDTAAERQAALARLFDYYLHTASVAAGFIAPHEHELPEEIAARVAATPRLSSYEAALSWLDTERVNLIRAAGSAAQRGLPSFTIHLSAVLFWCLDFALYLDNAEQLHTLALAIARDRGDTVAEAIALRGLGTVRFREQRLPEAMRYLEDAVALHETADDQVSQAGTLNCLGIVYRFAGRVDEATRHLQRSAELYQGLGHRLLATRSLVNLGLLLRQCGQYETAQACLRDAFTIAEDSDHRPVQAHAAYGLAGLYRDTERYDDALDYAHRAVTVARKGQFAFLEGLALIRLGTIHHRLGAIDQAQRCNQQALTIAKATANRQLEVMALNGAAETHTADTSAEAPTTN